MASSISDQEQSWEVQTGRQMYSSYAARGEIVPRSSQLYRVLDPVANAIARVADHQYYAPFRFVLLSEPEPNAFAMPGGNVYITTGMLSYLRNRDQLAGVICHEVNHDIHHDMYNVYQASQHGAQPLAYERAAEVNADRGGAYTCARAGFNPWGMVWNMRQHRGMGETAANSDHPSDDQRISNLVGLITSDGATFGRFRDNIALSQPLPNTQVLARYDRGASSGQADYQAQYPVQYRAQYQGQYPPPYQGQYPPQYPSQYQGQYPAPYQGQYPPQYPSQYQGQYPQPPPMPPCYPGC